MSNEYSSNQLEGQLFYAKGKSLSRQQQKSNHNPKNACVEIYEHCRELLEMCSGPNMFNLANKTWMISVLSWVLDILTGLIKFFRIPSLSWEMKAFKYPVSCRVYLFNTFLLYIYIYDEDSIRWRLPCATWLTCLTMSHVCFFC